MSAMLTAGAKRIGRFAKTSFTVIGFGVTAGAVTTGYVQRKKQRQLLATKSAQNKLLVLPFDKMQLIDPHKDVDLVGDLLETNESKKSKVEKISLPALVETIHEATADPTVVGIVGDFGHGHWFGGGLAEVEEVRTALRVFKESHRVHSEPNFEHATLLHKKGHDKPRPMVAHADTFANGSSNNYYYLASIFNEIHLQKQGSLNLFGLGTSIPFLKKTLEKYGAKIHSARHGAYKNAVNQFTESSLTREHKENVENYLQAINEYQNKSMQASRKHAQLTDDLWKLLQNSGSFTPEAAMRMGLIDAMGDVNPLDTWEYHDAKTLGPSSSLPPKTKDVVSMPLGDYRKLVALRKKQQETAQNAKDFSLSDRFYQFLQQWTKDDASFTQSLQSFGWYQSLQAAQEAKPPIETIATLSIKGAISDKTVRKLQPALTKIKQDATVKCVVVRVDSPGGSSDASETILQELSHLPQSPKIVVSFGNIAASGGYYIASQADKIFASPSTITGSIGVYGIRFDLSGVAAQYGVRFGHVATSEFALVNSPFAPMTKVQKADMVKSIDRVYDRFREVVRTGRELDDDYLLSLAEGRVWTGLQAKHNGLVDELGGWSQAIEYARSNYTSGGDNVKVVDMCKDDGLLSRVLKLLNSGDSSSSSKASESLLLPGDISLPKKTLPKKAFGVYLTMDENAAIRALWESGSEDDNN